MSLLNEFKKFAVKGNVVDMAVGLVIGSAFTSIVNSLVEDIIMPPIGLVTGGIDFSNMMTVLKGDGFYASREAAQAAGAVTVNWGAFLNNVITFLIVAWVLFLVVKLMNRIRTQAENPADPRVEPPRQEVLLEEIRDLLARREAAAHPNS